MQKSILLLAVIAAILSSCSPRITTSISRGLPPVDHTEEVKIYNLQSQLPENAIKIGRIDVGDSGFTTNCNYDTMLGVLLQEARKVGGNAVCITNHIEPNIMNGSCHQFSAIVFNVPPQSQQVVASTNNNVKNDTLKNGIVLEKLSNDTIQIVKKGLGYGYYFKGEQLTLTQLKPFFEKNTNSFSLYQSAKGTSDFVSILGYIGGSFVGYGFSYLFSESEVGLPMMGVGFGILLMSLPIVSSAENKLKKAVNGYNMKAKGTSYTPRYQLQLATTQNGVGIAIKF